MEILSITEYIDNTKHSGNVGGSRTKHSFVTNLPNLNNLVFSLLEQRYFKDNHKFRANIK